MKWSFGISNFLEELSSLSHSIVFLYFFALIAEEGFLISPCYFLELCIKMDISFLFSWRRKWQPTPVFLPGESHGQRSLVGYSPWGRKESDTTEWLHFTSFSPLPFACLFTAICKAFSEIHFTFLHFFFSWIVLITASCTMSQTSVHSSSGPLGGWA